ncbi:MAG: 3-deoxy-7-phosphoheptulonate synthase [Opitutales bacterium]
MHDIDDTRIQGLRPLLAPAILMEELAATAAQTQFVAERRQVADAILKGRDNRLLVVCGPCSIHDVKAAIEYAQGLKSLCLGLGDALEVVMRVYFEKPRTVVGWKGLINDPNIDGSFEINRGLRLARQLLLDVIGLGLPTGTEFLDTITPQFIADLVTWAAIGARTTESQVHRELASGLSMPVGFKNGTGGEVQLAIDAVRAAKVPHWFASVTKQGVAAIFNTAGNDGCHIILRGGKRTGTNYDAQSVAEVAKRLEDAELPGCVMVDCSHGNSEKDHNRQPVVAESLAEQIEGGSRAITGVMIESHLVAGNQKYTPGKEAVYGQSITDACISLEQTGPVLQRLAEAVRRRRG